VIILKTFEISGKLIVTEDQSHPELLNLLFEELMKLGIHFSGQTKEVKDK
jgi:hypothetical protein